MALKSKRGATALSGVLLLDKPLGWTSHDVIGKLRRISGEGRIGHAGTLDPDASGLMVVLVGHAAKLSNELIVDDKRYTARICFGSSTTTDDAQGEVINHSDVPETVFDESYARTLLAGFVGQQKQVPPDFSALKKDGKVAHKEARKGKPIEIASRSIEVYSADLLEIDRESKSWLVDFHVSKGSYIRALARDIGLAAHTHAHLCGLRRISSGEFSLGDACTLEELEVACETDSFVLADFFVPRDVLLESLSADKLIAASVAGRRIGPSVLSIGVFDGVHEGHQALLRAVSKRAEERGLLSTVMTFPTHPRKVIRPLDEPSPLMSFDEKVRAIKDCGIDEVIVLPFNHKISQQSAEDFLLKTLPSLVQAQELVVGENFRCGKGATCGPNEVDEIFKMAGVNVPVSIFELRRDKDGLPYSSTRIRAEMLEAKDENGSLYH